MIYLLGGSGYVGGAFQALFRQKGIRYRSVRRAELDYADAGALRAALLADRPEFLVNAAGYTGPGRGPYGFTEEDPPNFTFRATQCSFYSGSKGLGEEVLAGRPSHYVWRLRIPFESVDNPRNYLTKLMRYQRLLEATNSISELDEFVAAAFECWTRRVPFGTYNVTNPGRVTTREVVELIRRSGVCTKRFDFFASEQEFMSTAAKTPRSNCVLDPSKLASAGIRLTEVHDAIERDLRGWRKAA